MVKVPRWPIFLLAAGVALVATACHDIETDGANALTSNLAGSDDEFDVSGVTADLNEQSVEGLLAHIGGFDFATWMALTEVCEAHAYELRDELNALLPSGVSYLMHFSSMKTLDVEPEHPCYEKGLAIFIPREDGDSWAIDIETFEEQGESDDDTRKVACLRLTDSTHAELNYWRCATHLSSSRSVAAVQALELGAMACPPVLDEEPVTVPASSNIFGAGHSSPFVLDPAGGGGGTFPVELTEVGVIDIDDVEWLRFGNFSGQVKAHGPWALHGADGAAEEGTDINSYEGISGIVDETGGDHNFFLVGVFLNSSEPSGTAPSRLSFTDKNDYVEMRPALNQTFFIGDGQSLTGAGFEQVLRPPSGATRLFLGFADAFQFEGDPGYYSDNSGSLTFDIDARWSQTAGGLNLDDHEIGEGTCEIVSVGGDFNLDPLDDEDPDMESPSSENGDPSNFQNGMMPLFELWTDGAQGRPTADDIAIYADPVTHNGLKDVISSPNQSCPRQGSGGTPDTLVCQRLDYILFDTRVFNRHPEVRVTFTNYSDHAILEAWPEAPSGIVMNHDDP